jgi:hypothetical protein
MKTLEVQLPDDTLSKLEEAAERLNLSAEELLILSLQEKLTQLDLEFQQATDYVLTKNAELYKRLS